MDDMDRPAKDDAKYWVGSDMFDTTTWDKDTEKYADYQERQVKELEAENTKLREYATHKKECNMNAAIINPSCTCELEQALKALEE